MITKTQADAREVQPCQLIRTALSADLIWHFDRKQFGGVYDAYISRSDGALVSTVLRRLHGFQKFPRLAPMPEPSGTKYGGSMQRRKSGSFPDWIMHTVFGMVSHHNSPIVSRMPTRMCMRPAIGTALGRFSV